MRNLSKKYTSSNNNFYALKNVNLDIKNDTSIAIIGKSGAGKTTLLNILAMMDEPSSGEIVLNAGKLTNINKLSEAEKNVLRISTFGFVFQQFFLNENLNVLENVIFPLQIANIPKEKRTNIALNALQEVNLLDKKDNMPYELSAGQKQRVCIARSIINSPKIIFADEPTGNLDSGTSELIENLLFKIQKTKKTTLIIVTHDNDLANKCQTKIIVKDGQIISAGK
ncbi:MAG: ABC transporter ATP-binding protein [Bifidobacteriaceae bacterium]|nr:ABC transporter ATP-binding protein [Bifidobacteriaceae bacterium]